MNPRWSAALNAGARAAMFALIVLMLVGSFGGGMLAKWLWPAMAIPPAYFTLTVVSVAVFGAVSAGTFEFWRTYHRDEPPK